VPELNRFVNVRLTARALKTITKNGAHATLKAAGLI
jgi:large subunit ribosomal protein L28